MAQLAHRPFLHSTWFFTLCAALFALGGASCASSSGTSAADSSGGSGQAGSGTAGGSAQAGASGGPTGGSGGPTTGSAGDVGTTGTAGAPAACPAGTGAGDECPVVDSVCASAATCCHCSLFRGEGCGKMWNCALPANNLSECPALAPAIGSPCATNRLVCQYCGANGPEFRRCSYTADRSVPPEWYEDPGFQCYN